MDYIQAFDVFVSFHVAVPQLAIFQVTWVEFPVFVWFFQAGKEALLVKSSSLISQSYAAKIAAYSPLSTTNNSEGMNDIQA